MPKQDFLMRLVEQLRGLLPYILDLVKAGNYDEAHAVIDQAVRELVGIGTDGLVHLPDAVILDRLQADNATAWEDKCLFLTAVLVEEADILMKEGVDLSDGRAHARYLKALNLLLILAMSGSEADDLADIVPDVDQIVLALTDSHLPGQTCENLILYYEERGDYTAVEDTLFDWLENTPIELRADGSNPWQTGLDIFERLNQKTEAQLEAGGLTREEVAMALADLQNV
jgi:hypothetical protein